MTNDEAQTAAKAWAGEAGGKLCPQLTENELAGIVNDAILACTKTRADKPRQLPTCGTGALHSEQQYCFERGWREGAASVRRRIAMRFNAPLIGAQHPHRADGYLAGTQTGEK